MCNPMNPLYGALHVPYVPVQAARCALVADLYIYSPLRCRTSQYPRTFVLIYESLWNDFAHPVFYGVGLAGFKNGANASLFDVCCSLPLCLLLFYIPILFFNG